MSNYRARKWIEALTEAHGSIEPGVPMGPRLPRRRPRVHPFELLAWFMLCSSGLIALAVLLWFVTTFAQDELTPEALPPPACTAQELQNGWCPP